MGEKISPGLRSMCAGVIALEKAIKEKATEAKQILYADIEESFGEDGTKTKGLFVNGHEVGRVAMRKRPAKGPGWVVSDEKALLCWLLYTNQGNDALMSALMDSRGRELLMKAALANADGEVPDGVQQLNVISEPSYAPAVTITNKNFVALAAENLGIAAQWCAVGELPPEPDYDGTTNVDEPTYETEGD